MECHFFLFGFKLNLCTNQIVDIRGIVFVSKPCEKIINLSKEQTDSSVDLLDVDTTVFSSRFES